MSDNIHIGSSFNEFLNEDESLKEVDAIAQERVKLFQSFNYSDEAKAKHQQAEMLASEKALEVLERIKVKRPHLRMGQILSIALENQADLFYVSDMGLYILLSEFEQTLK